MTTVYTIADEHAMSIPPFDPRDPICRQTPESIARAKAAQRCERFAVVWPEIRKNPTEGIKMLMAVYEDAADVLVLWDLMSDLYGPATCSRHLETVLTERGER